MARKNHGDESPPRKSARVAPLLPSTEALKETTRIASTLTGHPIWRAAMKGATPREAVLVRRVDREDDYYYVVTLEKGGKPSARMAIGAQNAALLRCHGISKVSRTLSEWIDPLDAIRSREGRTLDLPGQRHPLTVRSGTVSVHPILIWKPCAASTSPLLPFHVLTIGDTVAYLRVDGRLYGRLTAGLSGR